MLPFTQSAAGTLTAADLTYDIGSSTYRWSDIHIQNLDIASEGRVENAWNLIAEYTATDSITSVEFTGLDGDTDEIYHIVVYYVGQSGTASDLYCCIHGNSAANYGFQRIRTRAAAPTAQRTTGGSSTVFKFGYARNDTTTNNNLSLCESFIYAKTGYERLAINEVFEGANETYINGVYQIGTIFSDKTTNITSLKFISTDKMATGTSIQIWAPSMNITATGTAT